MNQTSRSSLKIASRRDTFVSATTCLRQSAPPASSSWQ